MTRIALCLESLSASAALGLALLCVAAATSVRSSSPAGHQDPPQGAAPATQAEGAPADVVEPRVRVAGIDTLRMSSRVRFTAPGAAPHSLEVVFAFPARARVVLRPDGGEISGRVRRYRRGTALFGTGYFEDQSTRFEGARRADELLALEARLAVMLWPESHPWLREGEEHRAVIPDVGVLVADLLPGEPDGGRPRRVRALRPDGTLVESLEVTGWRAEEATARPRVWPTGLRLVVDGQVVWVESIVSVESWGRIADESFVPPDLRERPSAARDAVRAVDVLGGVVRDLALLDEHGRAHSLADAMVHAAALTEAARRSEPPLSADITVVLDHELAPRAVRLRLVSEPAKLPPGWRYEAPAPAWVYLLDDLGEVVPERLMELRRSTPPDLAAHDEVLLTVTGDAQGGVRLVLVQRAE